MAGTETFRSNFPVSLSDEERRADPARTEAADNLHSPALEHLTAIGRALFDVTTVRVLTLEQHERLLEQAASPAVRGPHNMTSAAERRQRREPVVVLDTLKEESWHGSALVRQTPPLRFYAEASMWDSTDTPIGMLCLMGDSAKMQFSAEECELLMRLAALTAMALEQRSVRASYFEAEQALLGANELYALATRATSNGDPAEGNRKDELGR